VSAKFPWSFHRGGKRVVTKEEYIREENRQVRDVALRLGIPDTEVLGRSELLYGIERRSPEALAELRDHLQKYREWWESALELESLQKAGRLTPSASAKHARLVEEREASQSRLEKALGAL
jgi:hypothetical protein